MSKKVTLQDIADEVHVSRSLVSLALSNSEKVNEDTRATIILTALRRGYDINKRAIRKGQNKMFSIVCSNQSYLNTFFWTEVVKGMENCMAEYGIGMDLVRYQDSEDPTKFLLETIDKRTSGLIIIAECWRDMYEKISRVKLPTVIVDANSYFDLNCDCVGVSNFNSAYLAAEYLLSKGHRDLCFVGNVAIAASFLKRRAGFRAMVESCGIEGVRYREIITGSDGEFGTFSAQKVREMLKKDDRPTAILCANDITALNIYNIIKELGLDCPNDVSLVGFDNIEYDHEFADKLTTFNISKNQLGRVAVKTLLRRVREPNAPYQRIELCTELLERESVLDLTEKS